MRVEIQIRAGGQIASHIHLASVDAAPILLAELPPPLPTLYCSGPHATEGSVSHPEAFSPRTELQFSRRVAINGSPASTPHAAQIALGLSPTFDRQPDISPAPIITLPAVSPAIQEVMTETAAPTAPAVSDQLSAPKANGTLVVSSTPGPDPSYDRVLEPSHGATTAVHISATTSTKAPPSAKPKSFGIFMGRMGRHCPRRGCSVPAPKRPWTGRTVAATKGVTEASQETEVTTPLTASQGAETFIAPPAEIVSTMGAARETDGVDKVPK